MGAGSTPSWFGDPLCSAKAGKGEEEPFVQDVQWGCALAWLGLCRGNLHLGENEADFMKQSSVLEAGGVFHSLFGFSLLYFFLVCKTPLV